MDDAEAGGGARFRPAGQVDWRAVVERHRATVWNALRRYDLSIEDRKRAFRAAWAVAMAKDRVPQDAALPAWLAAIAARQALKLGGRRVAEPSEPTEPAEPDDATARPAPATAPRILAPTPVPPPPRRPWTLHGVWAADLPRTRVHWRAVSAEDRQRTWDFVRWFPYTEEDAGDAFQGTWTVVLSKLEVPRGAAFERWVLAVAAQVAADVLRRRLAASGAPRPGA